MDSDKGIPGRGIYKEDDFIPHHKISSTDKENVLKNNRSVSSRGILLILGIIVIAFVSYSLIANTGSSEPDITLPPPTTTPVPTTTLAPTTLPPTTTPAPTTLPPPTTTPVPTTTLAPTTTLPPTTTTPSKIIKVYHFHATHQCTSCILAGEYAYYTIITYFPDEFSNGTITYDSLNYEDPKNSTIVNELNVYGSSVFVLEIFPDDTIVHNPTYNLFRRVSSKQSYTEYFKNYLEELL